MNLLIIVPVHYELNSFDITLGKIVATGSAPQSVFGDYFLLRKEIFESCTQYIPTGILAFESVHSQLIGSDICGLKAC